MDRRNGSGRIPLSARVWCDDEEVTLYVPAVDVSDGGICLRTSRRFETGRRVRLGICGPEGEAVISARVVWSRPSDEHTPATGLSLEGFERGCDVFERMVANARHRAERISRPDIILPGGVDDGHTS